MHIIQPVLHNPMIPDIENGMLYSAPSLELVKDMNAMRTKMNTMERTIAKLNAHVDTSCEHKAAECIAGGLSFTPLHM